MGWFLAAITAVTVGSYYLIKNWSKVSAFFSNLWTGIKSSFKDGVSWVMRLIQPLLTAVDTIRNSSLLGGPGRAIGSQASNATAAGRPLPQVPFGGMGGTMDAGGTIKIQLQSDGTAKVVDAKSNDKRIGFGVDSGALMAGY